MLIDNEKYTLDEKNYHSTEFEKRQIVLGNTFSEKNKHIDGWKSRMGGEYKKTSPFTVFRNGDIYQHYESTKYSDFLGNKSIDKKVIVILLENQGWLEKLSLFMQNESLRERSALLGKTHASNYYSSNDLLSRWDRMFESLGWSIS